MLGGLLVALLILGSSPGVEPIVASVADRVHDVVVGWSDADGATAAVDDCDDGHGCTPLAHHCPCCASVSALPPRAALPERRVVVVEDETYPRPTDRGPPRGVAKPDLRPPIA